jgi:hypothetical protein
MAVSSRSVSSSKKVGAVPVSRNLQTFFIVMAGIGILYPILGLIPLYVTNPASYRGDYALGVIATTLFPLLVLAAAYIFSPQYPSRLHRMFIAVVKTYAVVSVTGMIGYLKNSYSQLFMQTPNGNYMEPPAWVFSFVIDYIIMATALITVIVFSYMRYRSYK